MAKFWSHGLRHSLVSRALVLEETLPMIGRLLVDSDIENNARYAHPARDSVHDAAKRIAANIAAGILF